MTLYEVNLMKPEDITRPFRRTPVEVAVLVFDETNTLSFAASLDPLRAANRRAGRTLFNWHFVTPCGGGAGLTGGVNIEGPALQTVIQCDVLIVVGSFNVEAQSDASLRASSRRIVASGAKIIAADGGPELLALAGVLNGHAATCHWEELERFALQFPQVDVRRDRFCTSGNIATSGGAAPTIDVMLHLIGHWFGTALSARVASVLVHDAVTPGHQPQAPVSMPRAARLDAVVGRALDMMEATLEDPIAVSAISKQLGLTQRALEMRFETRVGQPPKQVYLGMRLAEALRLASDSNLPVRDIAVATGFASQSAFARAFRTRHGVSVREVRARRH